jgi:hypothetical protein
MNLPPNRAAWPARWRERYEERAGIIEFQANVSRQTAEFRAEQDIRKQARDESAPPQERTA